MREASGDRALIAIALVLAWLILYMYFVSTDTPRASDTVVPTPTPVATQCASHIDYWMAVGDPESGTIMIPMYASDC